MSIAVGIDLGSTFSVVSYVKTDGSVEVIPNSEGNRITPSVFAIDDYGQIMVGDLAADYESVNPRRVVRLVKRKMSDGFSKLYDFENSQMSPCEISTEIIKKLTDLEPLRKLFNDYKTELDNEFPDRATSQLTTLRAEVMERKAFLEGEKANG